MFRDNTLPEAQIYEILANRRRREAIRYLSDNSSNGSLSLRELSETIAARETGQSPPPQDIRESVYSSLKQTHLPKLEELGVVRYDRDACEVQLRARVRDLNVYMEVITRYGITWSEIYRSLGVVGLTTVVGALAGFPLLSSVDPLLWSSGFLILFVITIFWQLWMNRWFVLWSLRK